MSPNALMGLDWVLSVWLMSGMSLSNGGSDHTGLTEPAKVMFPVVARKIAGHE